MTTYTLELLLIYSERVKRLYMFTTTLKISTMYLYTQFTSNKL